MTTFLRLKGKEIFFGKLLKPLILVHQLLMTQIGKCNCVVSNIYFRVDAIFRKSAWRGIMARTKENFEATIEQKRVFCERNSSEIEAWCD